MNSPKLPFPDRFYGALLRLFPFDFRGEFESEMEQTFREQREWAAQRSGVPGLLRLWWETITGIFQTAPREHLAILEQDVRHAIRMMRSHKGYTAVATLTLALGIGANTAIVSVIDAVLLRPLPYQNDRQLVVLHQRDGQDSARDTGFSAPEIADYRARNSSFSSLVEYHSMHFTLLSKDEATRVAAGVVSPGYFTMFGIRPILGRDFTDADDRPGAPAVLLLSYEYWKRHCAGDPAIVGRTFQMNDRVHTVVGVLPAVPQYPDENDVYMPTSACPFRAAATPYRDRRMMGMFGRLKPGVTADTARADLDRIASDMVKEHPEIYGGGAALSVRQGMLRDELTHRARLALLVLLGAAGCVLLISCANVANLILARMSGRSRELTVRAALGAGRGRLLRQLLTESFLLGLMAAALGVVLASQSLQLLASFTARMTARAREIHLDASTLLFALAVAFATSIVFGSVAALCTREDLVHGLKEGPPASTAGPRRTRIRSLMVVGQVAFSFVLLIGAGLMLRSFYNLQQVDPGFVTERVLAVKLSLNWSKYTEDAMQRAFANRILSSVRDIPGVLSTAVASGFPLDPDAMGGGWRGRVRVKGSPQRDTGTLTVAMRVASPDYFRTLGIPIRAGRAFTDSDDEKAPLVAVVNESMARRYWPGASPVGQEIAPNRGSQWIRVVGVAGDVREFGPHESTDEVYLPLAQNPAPGTILVRTDRDAESLVPALRRVVRGVDSETAIPLVTTMDDARAQSLSSPRVMKDLLGLFAALALIIALAGIGGMLALTVSQRLHEIGIRVALGAKPGDIVGMVVGQGMRLVLIGLLLGGAAAFVLTGLMRALLFEVAPTDPVTFASVSAVLALGALLACYLPVKRALGIDPALALRRE